MLKELESLFSISLWESDSQAGIVCFIVEGGFMIGSYDQTEITHIILF